jgi:hypothetical protein
MTHVVTKLSRRQLALQEIAKALRAADVHIEPIRLGSAFRERDGYRVRARHLDHFDGAWTFKEVVRHAVNLL